jgi:hypothetical protein
MVTNISNIGFWILVDQSEYFVSFNDYPVFKKSTIDQILNFEMLSPNQLYWKEIDCDIELNALKNPQNFPLSYK